MNALALHSAPTGGRNEGLNHIGGRGNESTDMG